jgi:hypothetical protein
MKPMKAIAPVNDRTRQELQQSVESQLIEEKNWQRPRRQFVSVVNFTGRTLVTLIHIRKNTLIHEFQHCSGSEWMEGGEGGEKTSDSLCSLRIGCEENGHEFQTREKEAILQ